jgi:hypothetical protein
LHHILTYSKKEFHPISGWIRRIIEARTTTLEAEMLTLSVTVESLLQLEPLQEISLASKHSSIESQILLVQGEIKKLNLEESSINRLEGCLKSIKSVSATDRLRKLRDKCLIDKSLVKSWQEIRNRSAHGYVVERDKFEKYFKMLGQIFQIGMSFEIRS